MFYDRLLRIDRYWGEDEPLLLLAPILLPPNFFLCVASAPSHTLQIKTKQSGSTNKHESRNHNHKTGPKPVLMLAESSVEYMSRGKSKITSSSKRVGKSATISIHPSLRVNAYWLKGMGVCNTSNAGIERTDKLIKLVFNL